MTFAKKECRMQQAEQISLATKPLKQTNKPLPALMSIQWLRGIAALLVVVHHLTRFFSDLGIKSFAFDVGAMGVDIFFAISGFIMVYVGRNHDGTISATKSFYKKRVLRIFPMYWLVTLVYLSSAVLANPLNYTWQTVAKSALLVPSFYLVDGMVSPLLIQGWTLYYEVFFYAFFGVGLYLLSSVRAWIAINVFFIALIVVGTFIPNKDAMLTVYTNPLLAEFLLGGLIAHVFLAGYRLNTLWSVVLISLGVVAFHFLPQLQSHFSPPWVRVITFGLPMSLVLAGFVFLEAATQTSKIWLFRTGAWLGDVSYSLYLTHYAVFVFASVPALILWGRMDGYWHQISLGTGLMALALLVATLGYYWIEKPILNSFPDRRP